MIGALRDAASIPRRQLETAQRRALVRIAQAHTPVRRLISRHTRELLRRYFKAGKMDTAIADRSVRDVMIDMTAEERALYEAVEDYISHTYNRASDKHRSAVGFVMTIYRRRLASSFPGPARNVGTPPGGDYRRRGAGARSRRGCARRRNHGRHAGRGRGRGEDAPGAGGRGRRGYPTICSTASGNCSPIPSWAI